MAIDYGKARCGLAVTDDAQIVASALTTVSTQEIWIFLENYFAQNKVERLIVGQPIDTKGKMSLIEDDILNFIKIFEIKYPEIFLVRHDERFTSKMASRIVSQSGKSKKKRQEKGLIDKVSATLILQEYLNL